MDTIESCRENRLVIPEVGLRKKNLGITAVGLLT